MRFEGMNSNRRMNFIPFPRDAWIGTDQIKECEKVIVVTLRLHYSEQANTLLGDRDYVFFRFDRKPEAHDLLARATASAKSSSFDRIPTPL